MASLASFQQGDFKDFTETVEEFRKKYRNTKEWEIIRKHYEKIVVRSQNI